MNPWLVVDDTRDHPLASSANSRSPSTCPDPSEEQILYPRSSPKRLATVTSNVFPVEEPPSPISISLCGSPQPTFFTFPPIHNTADNDRQIRSGNSDPVVLRARTPSRPASRREARARTPRVTSPVPHPPSAFSRPRDNPYYHAYPDISGVLSTYEPNQVINTQDPFVGPDKVRDLTGHVLRRSSNPAAAGGYADVYLALWNGERVAVKAVRLFTNNPQTTQKLSRRLYREIRVWCKLSHPNVLPLYGITAGFGPHISMVCPWMENGTLRSYLECNTNLTLSARFRILLDVASGLSYLHSANVFHGDLSGSNILIDDTGRARLSDFGLSVVLVELDRSPFLTSSMGGTIRYAAPEIYVRQDGDESGTVHVRISAYSDIYSFGGVTYQTLSGLVPYHEISRDCTVLWAMFEGRRPSRPSNAWFTDSHWAFVNECWNSEPNKRPTMQKILSYLRICFGSSQSSA